MNLDQWLRHIQSVHFRSIDMELDRVTRVLHLVLPEGPAFPSIAVSGTNGKGSAVEMLTCILRETGTRVGTYTSPHLVRYTERVRVDRREVAEAELCAAFSRIESERGDIPLTYFEFGTLAALLVFQARGVDVAVLEVGLGGRLDAVNAVDAEAALITSVDIDHEFWLGGDRERIAVEKAGIFRAGKPAVCADPDPPRAIGIQARKIGADLRQLGPDFRIARTGEDWEWTGRGGRFVLPGSTIKPAFQANNAAGALEVLTSIPHLVRVEGEHVYRGLSSFDLKGRFQRVQDSPVIVLDVAHNVAAVRSLIDRLAADPCDGRTLAVFGMLKDKPAEKIAEMMNGVVDEWHLGTIRDERGLSAVELGSAVSSGSSSPIRTHDSISAAFTAARQAAEASDRILVFGSFHTVGDILRLLEAGGGNHSTDTNG